MQAVRVMSRFSNSVLTLGLVLGLSVGSASALSMVDGAHPAEYPPADFTGATYVDSRGCVYIRTGYAGAVNWVPMVTRSKEVVCGAKPTFATLAGTLPVPAAVPAPVVITQPAPLPAPVAISVPPGYRLAFDDGRFNPNRGVQTPEGTAQMNQIWTETLPRRLINQ